MKRSALFLLVLAMFIAAGTANALTLKSGEVLSSDGKVYSGASPEQRSAIVAQSKSRGLFGDGKKAGVRGSNIFVVVGEDVVFVPVNDVRGKSKEQMMDIIAEAAGKQIGPNAPDASDLARALPRSMSRPPGNRFPRRWHRSISMKPQEPQPRLPGKGFPPLIWSRRWSISRSITPRQTPRSPSIWQLRPR
jgi:hypothetical protein